MFKTLSLSLLILSLAILSCSKLASNYSWDLSNNKINSLSDSSKKLVSNISEPLNISVYSPSINVLNICNELLQKYKKLSTYITVELHEATIDHNLAAKLKIYTDHNIVLTYKNQQQAMDLKAYTLTEALLSNLIQKVMRDTDRWLAFLTGHQEVDPFSTSMLGLNLFTDLFKAQGMHIALLNLAEQQSIPQNIDTLIVVNPQIDLLPLEKVLLHKYLERGGKLLWFTEPDSKATAWLTEEFGVRLAPGVAIDPASTSLGSPHPAIKIITQHSEHPITQNLKTATILPWSGHLDISKSLNAWQAEPFITTNEQTWAYDGDIALDLEQLAKHKQQQGPLNIGVAFSRGLQRSLVIADSSFITNKYISLYANSMLTNNLLDWIQSSDSAYIFSQTAAKDLSYQPNVLNRQLYRYVFPFLIPLLLIGIGFYLQPRKSLAEP